MSIASKGAEQAPSAPFVITLPHTLREHARRTTEALDALARTAKGAAPKFAEGLAAAVAAQSVRLPPAFRSALDKELARLEGVARQAFLDKATLDRFDAFMSEPDEPEPNGIRVRHVRVTRTGSQAQRWFGQAQPERVRTCRGSRR